jgi:hypothetical protein
MSIKLHIEHLVLDGLPIARHHGPSVQAAIEAELGRLLGKGGIAHPLAHGAALPRANGRPIRVARETGAAGLGNQIAASIYSGIGR